MAYEIDPREIELVAQQNREENKLSDEFYAAHRRMRLRHCVAD
ncbi:hypothetical protein [Gordonia spumicola]|nr:hypothetical protein [Gordonia spumicola]